MKVIKYTVEISALNKKGETVLLSTQASTAKELQENIKEVLDSKSKYNVLKLLGLS